MKTIEKLLNYGWNGINFAEICPKKIRAIRWFRVYR